jgi:hypothetical protein
MSVIAAAVIGSAVVGGVSSYNASKQAGRAADQQAALGDASIQLGRDQFDWFVKEYEKTAPERAAAVERDGKVADAALDGMTFATGEAKRLSTRNQTVFEPLQDKIVSDAQAYDTPERREAEAARATADVEGAFGRSQKSNTRAMMRGGFVPGGAAAAALMQDASLQKAKMVAGATGEATRNVEQQGYARRMDAVGLGMGILGSQATQQNIATSSGNSAVSAGNSAVNVNQSGAGLMQTGFNGAQNGIANAGSLYGQAFDMQKYGNSQEQSAINQWGKGAGYWAASDEDIKTGTGKVTDGKDELAQVNATPVEKDWKYDPAKGGPDDGGQPHTGPMAQDVRATMGNKVAPGGKQIDLVSMNGKTMAAVQALSKQVTGLERAVAKMSRQGVSA